MQKGRQTEREEEVKEGKNKRKFFKMHSRLEFIFIHFLNLFAINYIFLLETILQQQQNKFLLLDLVEKFQQILF